MTFPGHVTSDEVECMFELKQVQLYKCISSLVSATHSLIAIVIPVVSSHSWAEWQQITDLSAALAVVHRPECELTVQSRSKQFI